MADKGGDRIMELKNRSQYLDKLISVQVAVCAAEADGIIVRESARQTMQAVTRAKML